MTVRRLRLRSRLALPALVAFSAVAVACGADEPDGARAASAPPTEPLGASATWQLRADVPRIDGAAFDAMLVPHEGPGLWVRRDAQADPILRPGAVTIVKGRGVLAVANVREEGDHLVFEPAPVGFGDFVEEGTLRLAGAARFDVPFVDEPHELEIRDMGASEVAPAGAEPPAEPPPPAAEEVPAPEEPPLADGLSAAGLRSSGAIRTRGDDDPLKEQTSFGKPGKTLLDDAKKLLTDGWTMSKTVKGDADALHYRIVLTKDSGGILARIQLDGTVKNLATTFEVAVKNRFTDRQLLDVATSGEADLTWEVGISEGSVGYNKLLLPGVAYRQAFMVGEVPMVLKVKSGFALVVGATGRNTTTTGRAHLTWSKDGSVRISGGDADANATGSGELELSRHNGTVAVGPSAFGIVATLPRIEIGVGVDQLFVTGAYFANTAHTHVESRGGIGGDPCGFVQTKVDGATGLYLDAGRGGSLLLRALELTENKLSKPLYSVTKSGRSCM